MHVTAPTPGITNETVGALPVTDDCTVSPIGSHHGDEFACEFVNITVACATGATAITATARASTTSMPLLSPLIDVVLSPVPAAPGSVVDRRVGPHASWTKVPERAGIDN